MGCYWKRNGKMVGRKFWHEQQMKNDQKETPTGKNKIQQGDGHYRGEKPQLPHAANWALRLGE